MRLNASINLFGLLAVMAIAAALFLIAFNRVTIDTDMLRFLPTNDPVIADGIRILQTNPIKDQIAIDIGSDSKKLARLVAAAKLVEARLLQSGLFVQVGTQAMRKDLTTLADQVIPRLPFLFTAGELQRQVVPLLTDKAIRQALTRARKDRYQMDGIEQASAMDADPLGLRHIVLARLAALNQAHGAAIRQDRMGSAESHHLLIRTTATGSGSNTTVAQSVTRFFRNLQKDLDREFISGITLTPTGGFRAALDNATIVKRDVNRALLWAAVGIGALLLAAFSHLLVGLMTMLPALAGTVMSFFVFSLIHDSISIMVLGFGGAVIAIIMGHGIAYMLYVDSGGKNVGQQASQEVRTVGLPALLTAICAFIILTFCGLPVFEQLGQFTAMGIGFSFLFVHTVLPQIIRGQLTAATATRRHLTMTVNRMVSTGKFGLALSLLVAVVLALFIRPQVNTDLRAMNDVSRETHAADELMTRVWGDIFSSVYLVTEADDLNELQEKNDRLLDHLNTETIAGSIARTVTPSLFFPGRAVRADNFNAWRQFWTDARIREVSRQLIREGKPLGFTHSAFAPFLQMLAAGSPDLTGIPEGFRPLLGISTDSSDGRWRQVTRITPTGRFDSQRFYNRMSDICTVFDSVLFSERMGQLLFGKFTKMLLIIGVSLTALLIVFFADAGLLAIALLPLAFAVVCTLGTLGIIGRPLDMPAVMLSIIILGIGVGYTLLMVRGYQRYQRFDHPQYSLVRTAIFIAAASTLVGFVGLIGADHNLLKSAGLISFFGIGYCLAGTMLILPPLLKRRFKAAPANTVGIFWHYRNLAPYPRLITRYKLRFDPLIGELATLVPQKTDIANILDVGCGYGVPACWMAERYSSATIHGIDPQPERARIAALVLGDRGSCVRGSAPDLPTMDVLLNLATMLDVSHFLQDWELEKTLERIHERLLPDGCVIMRSLLPPSARPHWTRRLAHLAFRISGRQACYRSPMAISTTLDRCGFEIYTYCTSGNRTDMIWHVARPR
jgi:predicted exporter/SAM-dependent methyltransferase